MRQEWVVLPGTHPKSIMPWSADAMTTVGSDQRGAGWRAGGAEPQGRTLLYP